jgi:RNA polymerase sigma factor (sigma-70 family)
VLFLRTTIRMVENSTKMIRNEEEHELIQQLIRGDESAFRQIVETRKSLVYNTVLGLLQNPEDAEDVTQEVFIKVYEVIHQFKGESSFSTWLYRIAVTKSLELIRKGKRKKRFAFITSLFGENNEIRHDPPNDIHPGVIMENREHASKLFEAIRQLPENQRVAFTLHKVEGVPYQEISEIMQLSVSAIESLIHRAKTNLKKILKDYYLNNK